MKKDKKPKLILRSGSVYLNNRRNKAYDTAYSDKMRMMQHGLLNLIQIIMIIVTVGCAIMILPESYGMGYDGHIILGWMLSGIVVLEGLKHIKLKKKYCWCVFLIVFIIAGFWFKSGLGNGAANIIEAIIADMRQQFDVAAPAWAEGFAPSVHAVTVWLTYVAVLIAGLSMMLRERYAACLPVVALFIIHCAVVLLSGVALPGKYVFIFIGACMMLSISNQAQVMEDEGASAMGLKMTGIGMAGIVTVFVLASLLITEDMYIDSDQAYQIKKEVQVKFEQIGDMFSGEQSFFSLFNTSAGSISEGRLDQCGDQSFTGRQMLEVMVNRMPENTIYLKGFAAGDFDDNRWYAVSEKELAHVIGSEADIRDLWNVQAESFSLTSVNAEMNVSSPRGVDGCFAPYAAVITDDVNVYADGWIESSKSKTFTYYPQVYTADESCYLYGDADTASVVPQYRDYVYEHYLQLPNALLEDEQYDQIYDQFVTPENDLLNTIDHIRSQMHSMTSYTLSPGTLPENEEFLSYFLYEHQEGYCMHFASAGVLLLRMNGYPARYAQGFVCAPGSFEKNDNGHYVCQVKDYQAHAWVEVYLDLYGWVPVEMTPGYSDLWDGNSIIAGESEEDAADHAMQTESENSGETLSTEDDETQRVQSTDVNDHSTDYGISSDEDNQSNDYRDNENISGISKILVRCLMILLVCTAAVALVLGRSVFKQYRYQKLFRSDSVKKALAVMYGAMHRWLWLAGAGSLKNATGSERAAAVRKLSYISDEMFIVFENTAWKAAFGRGQMDAGEYEKACYAYGYVIREIQDSLPAYKRWFAKVILCLPDFDIT